MPHEAGGSAPIMDGEPAVPETSPMEDLGTLQRELRMLIHDQLQLAALEVRLATHSLMVMISAAVCIGVLLMLAWVGLMAATGLSLVGMGLNSALVLLAETALTLLLVLWLYRFIGRRSRQLGFPATLRTLKPADRDTHKRDAP